MKMLLLLLPYFCVCVRIERESEIFVFSRKQESVVVCDSVRLRFVELTRSVDFFFIFMIFFIFIQKTKVIALDTSC